MSTPKYAFLSLLAREPLSGYDMKQQMNGRVSFFYKLSNNQLYPVLAKLEQEGLIRLHAVEQDSGRPARKVYEITPEGIRELTVWVQEPEQEGSWDEFMLKMYNSWLVGPDIMIPLLEAKKAEHEARLREYEAKIAGFRLEQPVYKPEEPLYSSIAVIQMGMQHERGYAQWCGQMIESYKRGEI